MFQKLSEPYGYSPQAQQVPLPSSHRRDGKSSNFWEEKEIIISS